MANEAKYQNWVSHLNFAAQMMHAAFRATDGTMFQTYAGPTDVSCEYLRKAIRALCAAEQMSAPDPLFSQLGNGSAGN